MKEAPKGIFNPFAPPKKKKPGIQPLDKRKTEAGNLIEPVVTFDGDRYILKFEGIANVSTATERLTNLLQEVNKIHEADLDANGIYVKSSNGVTPEKDEMTLKGPQCTVTVYVGDPPHTEVMAYRRIAFILKKLPIKNILTKYKATVSERG